MADANVYDVIIVGAGFSGLLSLHKLANEHKLNALLIDKATGVGGTWHYNRYPGALSDTETFVYQYSFDKSLLDEYEWNTKYIHQPEILKYLNWVADRLDLRKRIKLEIEMKCAEYNVADCTWTVKTDSLGSLRCRQLITAVGLLSKINYPNINGRDTFEGELYHTGNWPHSYDFSGKNVGIIGTGSTGNQVITAIANKVKNLTVFQRSAQYCVPAANGRLSDDYIKSVKSNYDEIWKDVYNSNLGFGFKESEIPTFSVSEEERKRIFQEAWSLGGGFRFMFGTFNDITSNYEANEEACKFIRSKISEIVKDPETARKLKPDQLYARRPLCDSGFYQVFNNDNVNLIDIKENPIKEIVPNGVYTNDGAFHDLDVLIFATGFDAVDGNYVSIDIRGKDGKTMKDHWTEGPRTYLGTMAHNFPNLFMVLGPIGPFTNIPPAIETQVDYIVDLIMHTRTRGIESVEPTYEAQTEWTRLSDEIASKSLFSKQASWIFGVNIPGKVRSVLFYFGGLVSYRNILADVVKNNYKEYTFSVSKNSSSLL